MRPLRPLLPSATRPRNEPLPPLPRDRVASACDQCRVRKIRCNGDRPVCLECTKRSTSCHYATRSAETQGQALKRKYDALHAENEAYSELFNLIKTRPDDESLEILRRIKTGTDVKDVLRRIKEADLLMQLNPSNPEPDVKHQYTLPLVSGIPAHLLNPDPEYYHALSAAEPATAVAAAATGAEQSKAASSADC
ncbi:hypothetical protein COCVIDRAFT_111061 [Bipolaris victoriae FI3]|uniref:Zn(2)-C6 fungal-type domain-containing protein n=2 Tax=Bipolaris TaxID=33194 RepID=W6YA80_COCC2|nr:uncharacterized protein COCCADRAFT_88532 [Bipolaris zeicola 26-R-13]XP_014552130.1 hypothetical protein COCVIDRAFT_111061 [Bipolaris victoriae FI3]EUC36282.1 hypothetical protein COCCADRAFT_88532 [Bipolaris zeicola 26-R-13]